MTVPADGVDYSCRFPALTHVVLEESWVLDIHATATSLVFDMELVLAPDHARYRLPGPGELHAGHPARLSIRSSTAIHYQPSYAPPAVDATGATDYGHIDAFHHVFDDDPKVWELSGEWGAALIRAPDVSIHLASDDRP